MDQDHKENPKQSSVATSIAAWDVKYPNQFEDTPSFLSVEMVP